MSITIHAMYNGHPMLAGVFDQLQKLGIRYQYQGIRLHKIDSMFYLRIFVESYDYVCVRKNFTKLNNYP